MRSLVSVCTLAAAALITGDAFGVTIQTSDGPVLVRNWGYQLQGGPPEGELLSAPLAASPHDLVVMDFARYGDEPSKFSPAEITSIKNGSGGDSQRKVAVAYVSIGEASEFRSYWDAGWTQNGQANSPLNPSAPGWLGPVNPNFPESRKVRYWDPGWQSIVFNPSKTGWLDQVVTQGFDGAYLDIVDAYYFWGEEATAQQQQPGDPADSQDAARRMAQFVVDMTTHARQTNAAFFVLPQNGEFILNDLTYGDNPQPGDPALRNAYLGAIAGIGIEDTYYRGAADENNPLDIDTDKVAVLQQDFVNAGKPVFVTDYVNTPAKVADFEAKARADGFYPYAAPTRDLDSLGPPVSTSPGDYNNDGSVDSSDYQLWRSHYGSTSQLDADGNHDGQVDAADYTVWRDAMAPSAAQIAVPEASAWQVGLLGCFVLALGRFHHRNGRGSV